VRGTRSRSQVRWVRLEFLGSLSRTWIVEWGWTARIAIARQKVE
jgi:hypothetical protein